LKKASHQNRDLWRAYVINQQEMIIVPTKKVAEERARISGIVDTLQRHIQWIS
jgi:hypothetical protein